MATLGALSAAEVKTNVSACVVYVVGQANQQGEISIQAAAPTLFDAFSKCGGVTRIANGRIFIKRKSKAGSEETLSYYVKGLDRWKGDAESVPPEKRDAELKKISIRHGDVINFAEVCGL